MGCTAALTAPPASAVPAPRLRRRPERFCLEAGGDLEDLEAYEEEWLPAWACGLGETETRTRAVEEVLRAGTELCAAIDVTLD